MIKTFLFILLTEFSVCSYNVENLLYQPTDGRYYRKLDAIAKVITDVNGWDNPALVGIMEVDRDSCLIGLCHRLRNLHYHYVHYDSPDRRGIDVGLLYDSTQVKVLRHRPIQVYLDSVTTTRDILYILTQWQNEFFHVFVCHLPSQLGGAGSSQWKRDKAFAILQYQVDSILAQDPKSQVVIMGDMNANPQDNIVGMTNLSLRTFSRHDGTHKYRGIWSLLDQFYVSSSLLPRSTCSIYLAPFLLEDDEKYLGSKPRRTNSAYHWQDGYSDHLPTLLKIRGGEF